MNVLMIRGSFELELLEVYPGFVEYAEKTESGNYIVCGIELTPDYCTEIEIRTTYEAVDASGNVLKTWSN